MQTPKVLLLVIAVLLVVLLITNPKPPEHKEAVKESLIDEFHKDKGAEMKDGWDAFGMALSGMLIDKMVDNFVGSDNYLLFSTTKLRVKEKSEVVGVGLLGKVFLFPQTKEGIKGFVNSNENNSPFQEENQETETYNGDFLNKPEEDVSFFDEEPSEDLPPPQPPTFHYQEIIDSEENPDTTTN